jgi:hypothetical protein
VTVSVTTCDNCGKEVDFAHLMHVTFGRALMATAVGNYKRMEFCSLPCAGAWLLSQGEPS